MHAARKLETPLETPRLVERRDRANGNVVEVFEVAPGELVIVESGQMFVPSWPPHDDE